jgi:hypothetical protein
VSHVIELFINLKLKNKGHKESFGVVIQFVKKLQLQNSSHIVCSSFLFIILCSIIIHLNLLLRTQHHVQLSCKPPTLLEILSFATSHYATGMQLVVVCNYLGHVCNYKFGIV